MSYRNPYDFKTGLLVGLIIVLVFALIECAKRM